MVAKYSALFDEPTCSNMPTDAMPSNGAVTQVPVVLQPDLDLLVQSGGGDPIAAPSGLGRAERDPDHPGAVVPGRMDGEAAPAATDIEDSLPGPVGQSELAADEVVLRFLGGLERLDPRARTGRRSTSWQARAPWRRSRC